MLEKSLHKFTKDFQTTINELQGKYVALADNNAPSRYFIGGANIGKNWWELKSLHASHTTSSEAFQDIKLLQNSHALEILNTKKRNTLKEDSLIELTTSLSCEVTNVQGIVQTLEQHLRLLEKRHQIHEKNI